MNDRRKFNAWQAKWLLKCVLRGDCSPRKALRTYRNTQFIGAYTVGNPPPAGDVVWAQPNGPDLQILGRRVIPTSTVVLGEEFDTTDQSDAIENGTVVEDDS